MATALQQLFQRTCLPGKSIAAQRVVQPLANTLARAFHTKPEQSTALSEALEQYKAAPTRSYAAELIVSFKEACRAALPEDHSPSEALPYGTMRIDKGNKTTLDIAVAKGSNQEGLTLEFIKDLEGLPGVETSSTTDAYWIGAPYGESNTFTITFTSNSTPN